MEIHKEYDLIVAMDGESALEAAEEEPPALILLEIMPPDINGFEVCRRLKRMPETATVPVIFLSALSEDEEKQKALDLGAVDFIIKPFDPAEIQSKVFFELERIRIKWKVKGLFQSLFLRRRE
jgi:DNA-binding response OmpR family regulator